MRCSSSLKVSIWTDCANTIKLGVCVCSQQTKCSKWWLLFDFILESFFLFLSRSLFLSLFHSTKAFFVWYICWLWMKLLLLIIFLVLAILNKSIDLKNLCGDTRTHTQIIHLSIGLESFSLAHSFFYSIILFFKIDPDRNECQSIPPNSKKNIYSVNNGIFWWWEKRKYTEN